MELEFEPMSVSKISILFITLDVLKLLLRGLVVPQGASRLL